MSDFSFSSLLLALIPVLGLAFVVNSLSISDRAKQWCFAGIGLRGIGVFARQYIAADSLVYLQWGEMFARYFSNFDFSPFYEESFFRHGSWLGTNFVGYPCGLFVTLLGTDRLAVTIAFALLPTIGLLLAALAFRRTYPQGYKTYWAWLFLIPSLWFWPSSIGKEALMLLGLGTALYGFVGKQDKSNWWIMALGVALVFCVRPQIAAVFMFSLICSRFLNMGKWSSQEMLVGLVIALIAGGGFLYSMQVSLGGAVSTESVQEFFEEGQRRSAQGGSQVDKVGVSLTSLPIAMVNVLFRPFPWEAGTPTAAFAAAEIILIWLLLFWRYKILFAALRKWRDDRTLRLVIPFIVLYVVGLGLSSANLGIISRQRVLVFPFLFWLVEAGAYYHLLAKSRSSFLAARPPRTPAYAIPR